MLSAIKGWPGRLSVTSPWKWALLLFSLLGVHQILHQLHLDDRLYFWISSQWHEGDMAPRSLLHSKFRVTIDAREVHGVNDNLSGLSYDHERGHIWAVVNNPEQLLLLDRDGRLLEHYPLNGFSDVEGVAYLGDGQLLVSEERSQALVRIQLPDRPRTLYRDDYRALTLSIDLGGNQGFEGLDYDRRSDRLFVVKEHSPRKLYEIRGLKRSMEGDFDLEIIDRQDWVEEMPVTDLSSVHFDACTGHLMVLSDQSKMLVELDHQGKLIGYQTLLSGFAGLQDSVPQGEGMTFDEYGNLFLVSEPNLFYRFEKADSGASDHPDTGNYQCQSGNLAEVNG